MKMRRSFINFTFAVMLAAALVGFSSLPETGAARTNADVAIGAKIENFTLADIAGAQRSFDELKGKNATIVMFLSKQCPVVQSYNARISKLAADYSAKGVNVVGLNSNATETLADVKMHAEKNYAFPMLIDKGNVIADKFGASVTPEVYVFDKDGKLVYRGAIDNDRSGDAVTTNHLRDALDAVLAGKPVAKTDVKAFGCTIKRAS